MIPGIRPTYQIIGNRLRIYDPIEAEDPLTSLESLTVLFEVEDNRLDMLHAFGKALEIVYQAALRKGRTDSIHSVAHFLYQLEHKR